VKVIGYTLFGGLAVALITIFVIGIVATMRSQDEDTAEVAARKAQCRKLERHIFEISPDSGVQSLTGTDRERELDALVAKVPIEDIEQCGAAYPEAIACMEVATDLAAVATCVPQKVECSDDKPTEVTGTRPIYELAGECKTVRIAVSKSTIYGKEVGALEIAGSDNMIRIGPAKSIALTGANNYVTWRAAEDKAPPKITDTGANNRVAAAK
jgi:hypothetical protein